MSDQGFNQGFYPSYLDTFSLLNWYFYQVDLKVYLFALTSFFSLLFHFFFSILPPPFKSWENPTFPPVTSAFFRRWLLKYRGHGWHGGGKSIIFSIFFATALRLVGQIFNFFAKKSQNFRPCFFKLFPHYFSSNREFFSHWRMSMYKCALIKKWQTP